MTTLLRDESEFGPAADAMINTQLRPRGISDPRVLDAMRAIPRHCFLAPALHHRAYEDVALPTLDNQTISQPYMVARMTADLEVQPDHHVLEVGAGSGYQTMILARLARRVTSLELSPALADLARQRLADFAITNVAIHTADGSLGYPPDAPYDRILVTAAAPDIPPALVEQLADPGRLIIPTGPRDSQMLTTLDKHHHQLTRTESTPCRFVPLLGAQGWPAP